MELRIAGEVIQPKHRRTIKPNLEGRSTRNSWNTSSP